MDSSASMLVNDPEKLRDQGARLFLQFLKSGDKLAVVRFDESAEVVRPLSPFNSDQLPALQNSLASIQASGQYTDLNAGLQAAQSILSKVPSSDGQSVIILLSDGKMDPNPKRGSTETHLDELTTRILPQVKSQNIKVYTLAFSQDADRALLQHIAEASNGANWFTPNSDTIHESFADLFLSVKKPQVVPYGSKGFKIDNDIEEATFYINQPEGVKVEIEDPNEERFSAAEPGDHIRWFDGKKFSVITISQPESGEWKLIGVNPEDGFATILTNLRLVTDWPNSIPLDKEVVLRARLYEGKIPVDLEAMSQAVSFAFQITPSDRVSEPIVRDFLLDDGTGGDEKAADGVFSKKLKLADSGEYRLRVLAKGPTFERQLQIPFRVRPPLMTFSIEEDHGHQTAHAEEGHGETEHGAGEHGEKREEHGDGHAVQVIEGSERSILQVALNEEGSTLKNIAIVVNAVDRDHNKFSVNLKPAKTAGEHGGSSEGLTYQVSAASLPKDGTFELKAYLKAQQRDGKPLSEESPAIKFSRTTVHELATKEVVPEPESKHEEKAPPAPVEQGFEWLALVLVTVLNLGLGAGLFMMLKKKKPDAGATYELPALSPLLKAAVEDLEKRAQQETINFDDPRFTVAAEAPPAASVASVAAPAAEPDPPAEEPPAGT